MIVGNRIDEAISKIFLEDYENALIQISIALDATGKKKYGSQGVGARIKKFVEDHETFILNTALSGRVEFAAGQTIYHNLGTFGDVLYKTIRCGLLHGDDVSKQIVYMEGSVVGLDNGRFIVTALLLWGLVLSIIGEKVNAREMLKENPQIEFRGVGLNLNEYWGQIEKIKSVLV